MLQAGTLLVAAVYFALAVTPRRAPHARTLFTVLALLCVPWFGAAAWTALHAVHLAHEVRSCASRFSTRDPVSMLWGTLTAGMCVFHLQCAYTAPDAYWFLARQRAATAAVAIVPRGRAAAQFAAVVALWGAATWFLWRRELTATGGMYAATLLPHLTFKAQALLWARDKQE